MADRAMCLGKQRLAVPDLRIVDASARRYRHRADIKFGGIEAPRRDFRFASHHLLLADSLHRRTVLVWINRRTQSDVVQEGDRDLFANPAMVGFQAEAAEHGLPLAFVPTPIGLAADAGD